MIIFTSICANYLHKARCLAESVKTHMPDAQFFVCLTEREMPNCANFDAFDQVILSKDMWKETLTNLFINMRLLKHQLQ